MNRRMKLSYMKTADRIDPDQLILQINKINKSFSRKKVLDEVSVSVRQGEILALLGPSGCGKTTFVKIIAGISRPDSGTVLAFGRKMPDFKAMEQIGYMAQSAALYPSLNAAENLRFFGTLAGLKGEMLTHRIQAVLEIVGLKDHQKKQIGLYSGGMKQRLALAATLLAEPALLILDEPTVGIDPLLRQSIWQELKLLKQNGVSIILTTHVMDEAEQSDRVALMRDGRILICESPGEILNITGEKDMESAFIKLSRKEEER